jgi:glycosyltransferase involved in cell wall biosynthesis
MGAYARKELGIRDVLVAPNGGPLISEDEIRERRKKRGNQSFTVFYSGSAIYPWQGLDLLAEVIKRAETEEPDIRFLLAVNQQSENIPRCGNVEVVEKLTRDQVLDQICAADVCIALHPDWYWTRHGVHGSPTKLWEYMACMTPVVTSNRGQMAEIIRHGENGLLTSDDPEDVLSHIIRLRDDKHFAEAVGRAGWAIVQDLLNWPRVARETIKMFERAVERREPKRRRRDVTDELVPAE